MSQVLSMYKWFINLKGKSFLTSEEIDKYFYRAENDRLYLKDENLVNQYFVEAFKDVI